MQQYFWESCDDLKSPTNNKKVKTKKNSIKVFRKKHEDYHINMYMHCE